MNYAHQCFQTLSAYHIDRLNPHERSSPDASAHLAQKFVLAKDVSFFTVGKLRNQNQERTTLVYVTKNSKVSLL